MFGLFTPPQPLTRPQIEDKVKAVADPLTELEQAILYHYLHASGWTLDRATKVKFKAWMTI